MMVDVKHQPVVWPKFIELIRGQKFWMAQIAGDFDLTVQMAQAINELQPGETITMKDLSVLMWCDASNATGIVDRLEARGLVERRPAEHDRRVKCVVLTPTGKRLRRKIVDRFREPPPAIAALSDEDQAALSGILDRALANAHRLRPERGV